MSGYAFACNYSNVDLTGDVIESSTPISTTTSILSGTATGQVLSQFNHGETLNVLLYNGTIMQDHPIPAGGCEYQEVNVAPVSGASSVMYQGPAFVDPTARVIFHELIHELFKLTKQPDTLHEYLIAHGGYGADLWADLVAVFNGNDLNTPQAIAALKAEITKQHDKNPRIQLVSYRPKYFRHRHQGWRVRRALRLERNLCGTFHRGASAPLSCVHIAFPHTPCITA